MKSIQLLLTATIASFAIVSSAHAGASWMTDIDSALAKAEKEKKNVLVQFTGSDWCPACIMMEEKVFSKKKFADATKKNFILVKIDMPDKDKDLKKKNTQVMRKYKVSGIPSVLLFGDDGHEFYRFSASQFPNIEKFLAHLDQAVERKDLD